MAKPGVISTEKDLLPFQNPFRNADGGGSEVRIDRETAARWFGASLDVSNRSGRRSLTLHSAEGRAGPGDHHRINALTGSDHRTQAPSPARSSLPLETFDLSSHRAITDPQRLQDGFRQNISRWQAPVARSGSPHHIRSKKRCEDLGRQSRYCRQVSECRSNRLLCASCI